MLKSLRFLFVLLFFSPALYGQQDTADRQQRLREDLLAKARLQKTFGDVMTVTGLPVFLFSGYTVIFWSDDDFEKSKAALVCGASAVFTFIGTRLSRSGRQNKRKAISLGLTALPVSLPALSQNQTVVQPSLQLKFYLHPSAR